MSYIKTRSVLHFPGFEPLSAQQHFERFERASALTSNAWSIKIDCHQLAGEHNQSHFSSTASGPNWTTDSTIHVLDIADYLDHLQARPFWLKIITGYLAFLKVLAWGGAVHYFRHAWRFALFFLFPFALMTLGIAAAVGLAMLPLFLKIPAWAVAFSAPVAIALFCTAFLPFSERLYTQMLFSNWKCATDLAVLQEKNLTNHLSKLLDAARNALSKTADEHLIVSHSIGGQFAVHTIGTLLEREPWLFDGKKIVFATLGSGLLQTALLTPAVTLRKHISSIADHKNVVWFDVQCHTDVVNFYGAKIAAAAGYTGLRPPKIVLIRVKNMLEKVRYQRIKRDLMRVHRQYVMGNDSRANFDFPLLCAGPFSSAIFGSLNSGQFAPIDETGAI